MISIKFLKNTSMFECHLPIGQEDNTFDGEELENGIVRTQEVFRGEIEEEEGVEGN